LERIYFPRQLLVLEIGMKVLLVGKGGRENAIAWKIAQSPRLTQLYCAPGSLGMAQYGECRDIDVMDIDGQIAYAREKEVDLVVIGPENPLEVGITDRFEEAGFKTFGPSAAAAKIETDKDFALDLMHRYGIPTGAFATFSDPVPAKDYIKEQGAPIVLKAAGLAAGKGVIIAETLERALEAVDEILVDAAFGTAGARLVVMEYLDGEEASIFGFTDGKDLVYTVSSQDHKRIGEGETGPNTGGMGAYAPAPVVTPELEQEVYNTIVKPTVDALAAEGTPFKGILYGGIIFTAKGPQVIEFNCRLGDPEAQVVLPLLKTDILDIFEAGVNGNMADVKVEIDDRAACCVVMASDGYPTKYEQGFPIYGISEAEALGDVIVYHAGTDSRDGQLLTDGGRVLAVTGIDKDIASAIDRAYLATAKITFENQYMRRDIGFQALGRLKD
jgi:phosphoribosylamine--glycine ligase